MLSFRARAVLTPEAGFELARMVRETGARCAHRPAIQPNRVHGSRPCGGLRISAEALAHAARRFAPHSDRAIGLWRLCLSSARRQAEVARASDLNALETLLQTVPAESLAYHGDAITFRIG